MAFFNTSLDLSKSANCSIFSPSKKNNEATRAGKI